MKQLQPTTKFLNQVIASVSIFISRLGVLPANISPLGSFGFFSNPLMFGISIVAFDVLVKGIYPGFWLTYLGFAAYPLLGYLARNNLDKQIVFLPLASLLFFLLSNLGVWWYWYDHTFAKLILCYTLALPFYTRTLLGDLVFGYGYLIVKHFQTIKNKLTVTLTTLKCI